MALPRRADHTREDLLGPRAAGRAIPATDLAIDDGGADGVFGAPVGRVHVGGPQEGEHGRELAVEMGREALGRGQGGRRVDEPAQAGEQAPIGHGEPLIGDRLRIAPIAEREGVGEDGLHAGRPGAPRMVGVEQTTPAEQMRQTALVPRVGEAAIGRPAIANQHTVEVRAQDRGRVVKAPPGANRIHGGRRRRKRPQPVQHGADAPAGFIGTDDGTPADLGTQRAVGRRGHARRAMQGVGEAARRHPEPEAVAQQRRNLFERHADVFVQEHDVWYVGLRTLNTARGRVAHLRGTFGGQPARAITTDAIRTYQRTRRAVGAAAATINRETSALNRMLHLAMRCGALAQRLVFPERLEERGPRQGFFEHADYLAVRAYLPPAYQDVLDFAYISGWRKREIEESPLERGGRSRWRGPVVTGTLQDAGWAGAADCGTDRRRLGPPTGAA